MEAMAARVACASTRLAGVPEMVIDGETGRLVDERQPEAFAGILETLLGDPEGTESMGDSGYALAKQIFSKQVTANSLRKYLIQFGLVRFDASLAAGDFKLFPAYLAQFGRRIRRLFRRLDKHRIG